MLVNFTSEALERTGVESYVARIAHLGDVGILMWINAFGVTVEGFIFGSGQPGQSLADLSAAVSLLEGSQIIPCWQPKGEIPVNPSYLTLCSLHILLP